MKTFLKLMSMEPAEGDGPPVFRITSPNLDRHKDRVLAIKADGEEFRVPLLWNHDDWNPAIGVARCYRQGDQWLMTPSFDGACETSRMVGAKVKARTLEQCSIRLVPLEEPVPNAEGGYDYPLVEVPEVSIVNMGANQDAVRLRSARSGGRPRATDGAAGGLLKQMARRIEHLQAQLKRLLKALGEDEEANLDEEDDEEKELGEDEDEEANLGEDDDEEKELGEDEDEEANLGEDDDEEKELGEDEDEEANLGEDDDEEKELGEDEDEEANLGEDDDEEKELGEDEDEEANLDEEDDEEKELGEDEDEEANLGEDDDEEKELGEDEDEEANLGEDDDEEKELGEDEDEEANLGEDDDEEKELGEDEDEEAN
ncbi:hypothetical protein, partial [Myxococcus sp. CA018]|uniref:hypothetical protein n=1 Tax=Myxococcus sp. CA018 TaxID=2651864 RepID=UPI0013DA6174